MDGFSRSFDGRALNAPDLAIAGAFIPYLRDDRSILIMAAAADRTSFGCSNGGIHQGRFARGHLDSRGL